MREHRAILAAMTARDFPRLEAEVRNHNRGALAAYLGTGTLTAPER